MGGWGHHFDPPWAAARLLLLPLVFGCALRRSQLETRTARNPTAAHSYYTYGHMAATWRGVIISARQITYGTRLLPL